MRVLFKFFVYIFIFLSFSAQIVSAKDIKFVQITDSHFSAAGTTDYANLGDGSSIKVLENAVADINSIPDLDFVVFTGDNIDKSNLEDLEEFILVANRLNVPYYIVIGNHEVFKSQDVTKADYLKTVSKCSKCFHEKKPNYVFQKDGIVFIVVDGAKEVIPGPAGYYKKETLSWLDKKLCEYKNSKVVIFQHFPIVEPYYHRSHTTFKKEDYLAMLKKHKNVIGIFSGHYHANGEQMVDGVYHVSTPALIVPPHDYKIVEISKTKGEYQIYTQLRHAE